MSKDYSWAEIRENAAERFGGTWPDAALEEEVVEHFREAPARVIAAIADVANAYEAGRIHSPWPFLRSQLAANAGADVVVSDESERERKVANARQWLKTAGVYYPTATEVDDALFGDTGPLRAWAANAELRAELLDAWSDLPIAGAELELEAAERISTQVDALERADRRSHRSTRKPGAALLFTAPGQGDWLGEEPPVR